MARDFQINGECLVQVKGGAHLPAYLSGSIGTLAELGLSSDQIQVTPRFYHSDFHTDDFGPNCPAEVQFLLAELRIGMTLVHYDKGILDVCVNESMGGTGTNGMLVGAGTPLGGYKAIQASGCHYISLNLSSPVLNVPWRFPAAYLAEPPVTFPLGTERSLTKLNWRVIPYKPGPESPGDSQEIMSSGAILWNHTLDT